MSALPAPVWGDRSRYKYRGIQWIYPFHLMAIGQATFVANAGPAIPDAGSIRGVPHEGSLAVAAYRAIRTYRKYLKRLAIRAEFETRLISVAGVTGLVIRRLQ